MTPHRQLETLALLREQRLQRAQRALAEQQRQCRTLAARLASLDAQRDAQRQAFDRQERAWFGPGQETALSGRALEDVRQALEAHHHDQAELEAARREADQQHRDHLDARERCAQAWRHCLKADQSLARLQAHRQRADRRRDEVLAELDADDQRVRGEP